MTTSSVSTLVEQIQKLVDHLDLEGFKGATAPEDPILQLLHQKLVSEDLPADQAIIAVVDVVSEYAQGIRDCLDFPPKAAMGREVQQRLEAKGLSSSGIKFMAGMSFLHSRGELYAENGWFAKLRPPLRDLTRDDIQWLTGTGRFAQ